MSATTHREEVTKETTSKPVDQTPSSLDDPTYDRLVVMWGIQDNLLQYYRTMFITIEAILFALAVFVASSLHFWTTVSLSFLGGILTFVWRKACSSRGCDVWYFQHQIRLLENGKGVSKHVLTEFKKYQNSMSTRDKLKEFKSFHVNKDGLGITARWYFDTMMPWLICGLWVLLPILVWIFRTR